MHTTVAADTFFPDFDLSEWQLQHEQFHPADAENQFPFTFSIYQR